MSFEKWWQTNEHTLWLMDSPKRCAELAWSDATGMAEADLTECRGELAEAKRQFDHAECLVIEAWRIMTSCFHDTTQQEKEWRNRVFNWDRSKAIFTAADRIKDLKAENERLRRELGWYGETVRLACRRKDMLPEVNWKIQEAQKRLKADGGKRAREAVAGNEPVQEPPDPETK